MSSYSSSSPGKFSRRKFLKIAGSGLAGASLLGLAGCGGGEESASANSCSADGDMWKQCQGTTLRFISENTAPTAAIMANLKPFTDLTGINMEISTFPLEALVQKVALDFGAGRGQYQVVYADPYQVLAPYRQALVDLNKFMNDDNLPSIPNGVDDFFETQLAAAGRFSDTEELLTLPYDNPTMIWMYRKDLFDKHGPRMEQDLGFDPTPSGERTWEEYFQTAKWFNDNADEVPYGTGHQAKQHDSLMCDFSNVLWSYGGDYFQKGKEVGRLGTVDPGNCILDNPKAIEGADFYNKLVSVANPGSTSWDWTAANDAFVNGEMAMVPNWHEFAASIYQSSIGSKVGYSVLPKGPVRSSDMYGGTGIAINAGAPEAEQRAAWLFLVWATSPETQKMGLFADAGGGTPTRESVYEMPEVQEARNRPSQAPNMLTAEAVFKSWEPENVGLRPKIPSWNECDTIIYTELSKMLVGQKNPEQAMQDAKRGFDQATETLT